MEQQIVPVYLVAHVGFSQDRVLMVMSEIASAHWLETEAVEKATYDQLGEFVYEGRPYKRESVVYRLQVEKRPNKNINEIYVVWSTARALDGTGRFASRITGLFLDEPSAKAHIGSIDSGDIDINGWPFRVENHVSKVSVK